MACARFSDDLDQDTDPIFFDPSKADKIHCFLCRSKKGVCSPCSVPSCTRRMHVTCAQDNDLILKSINPRLFCPLHREYAKPSENIVLTTTSGSRPSQWPSSSSSSSPEEKHQIPLYHSHRPVSVPTRKRSSSRRRHTTAPTSKHGTDDDLSMDFYRQSSIDTDPSPSYLPRSQAFRSPDRHRGRERKRVEEVRTRSKSRDMTRCREEIMTRSRSKDRAKRQEEINTRSRSRDKIDRDGDRDVMDWEQDSSSKKRVSMTDIRRISMQEKHVPPPTTLTIVSPETLGSPRDIDRRHSCSKSTSLPDNHSLATVTKGGKLATEMNQLNGERRHSQRICSPPSPDFITSSSSSSTVSPWPGTSITTTTTTTTTTKTTRTAHSSSSAVAETDPAEELKVLQRRYDDLHNKYGEDKMKNLTMKENLREIFGIFKMPLPIQVPSPSSTTTATATAAGNRDPRLQTTTPPVMTMMPWGPDRLEEYVQALRDVMVTEAANNRTRSTPLQQQQKHQNQNQHQHQPHPPPQRNKHQHKNHHQYQQQQQQRQPPQTTKARIETLIQELMQHL